MNSFWLQACTQNQSASDASLAQHAQLPWFTAKGGYSLQNIAILSLNDWHGVRGDYAEFHQYPVIVGSTISGYAPEARFIENQQGLVIPKDYTSMQLFSLYAHIEKLALWDKSVGSFNLNSWPIKVGVSVGFQTNQGLLENNAMYVGALDSILFVPYTEPDLSIAMNGGIIAHEHFHSLFYHSVVLPAGDNYPNKINPTAHDSSEMLSAFAFSAESEKRFTRSENIGDESDEKIIKDLYHQMLLSAINEGLADVWGWLYTNNPNFIAASIASAELRKLNLSESQVLTRKDLKATIRGLYYSIETNSEVSQESIKNLQAQLRGYSYLIGTRMARNIYKLAKLKYTDKKGMNLEQRQEVAKVIVATLPTLGEIVKNLKEDEELESNFMLEALSKQWGSLTEKQCQLLVEEANLTNPCEQSK